MFGLWVCLAHADRPLRAPGFAPSDPLLDLGIGGRRQAFEAMRRGAGVTALDSDAGEVKDVSWTMRGLVSYEEAVQSSGGKGGAAVGVRLNLRFPDAAFDRVIAAEVLEHVPDDGTAISELARVLQPGGTMAVTIPRWWPELVTWAISDDYHNKPSGHIRIYRQCL